MCNFFLLHFYIISNILIVNFRGKLDICKSFRTDVIKNQYCIHCYKCITYFYCLAMKELNFFTINKIYVLRKIKYAKKKKKY